MKFEGTYGDLFAYNIELDQFARTYPAVSKLLGGGYEAFHKHNSVHLQHLSERLTQLYELNVRKDGETGKYKMDSSGEAWDFLSTMHENHFKDEWHKLMEQPCTFIIGG